MTQAAAHSDRHTALVAPVAPVKAADHRIWGQLHGSSDALAICESARAHQGLTLVITCSTEESIRLEQSMRFYLGLPTDEDQPAITPDGLELLSLPDWETLPYDLFSPHQDITSRRIRALHRLPTTNHGVLVVPARTLMHRLPPVSYLQGNTLLLEVGQSLDIDNWRMQLESAGYRHADNVYEHGEYAVRGAILDIFPMGATRPYRIDLFDDEIETLRTFDPETQRSIDRIERIELLPANEFPWHKEARSGFRNRWFEQFPHADKDAPIYQDVTHGITPPGIEYYLPLFFDQTATLFDYLPGETLVFTASGLNEAASAFDADTRARYEDRRHDRMRPILPPAELFLQKDELFGLLKGFPRVTMTTEATESSGGRNCQTDVMPDVAMDGRAADPAGRLKRFISEFHGRVLICAESSGRREALIENLADHGLKLSTLENWQAFVSDPPATLGITVAPMEYGLLLPDHHLALITETALFGERVLQRRRREKPTEADDAGYRDLSELRIGAPVVHIDHGVGRYQGLETITVEGEASEFLMLEYAGGSKLYVPVSSLHLISRYTGSDTDHAPLHKLGTDRWSNAKQKALEKIRDTAAELLDVYARREARKGFAFEDPKEAYRAFAAGFPFEETPDQQAAIEAVFEDMVSEKPMDRLVCGDVGFGKTEVAMRAAFMATYSGKQVAVLVPTTLLAQQHYESFRDRFSDTAVHVELLSRFRSGGQTTKAMAAIEAGKADIVIGTHKLLQGDIKFKNLGLVIIDEEHRFGVQQKERLKALRAEVDMLNLTATPIPRTLNMAMGHLRDLSIIATPPARRLSVKTFVRQRDEAMVKEAILREVLRGGQVYFLHNDVATIEKTAEDLRQLIPEARVGVAHGQMRERELEQIMSDFYHKRFNVLVCTTIIETGIDIPSANTIIIERADKFGLAQLHQLRGRVGRSHHQAYAYLLTPPPRSITADAKKRLEAISEAQDLGAGFMLATHDLEIRGAGELLGEEQSGQIESIGFTLYMQLLDEAVEAIRDGRTPNAELPLSHGTEMNLRIPALIPEDYLPDVHNRLMLYKRIASVNDKDGLKELQVEMIDRFGLLPEPAKNLIRQSELRIHAEALGIVKVDAGKEWARLEFGSSTPVDPLVLVKKVQSSPDQYRLEGANSFRFRLKDASTSGKLDGISDMLGQLAS
ncbi:MULTISPECIES: transcription-repair coupling factor [Marinobacter]|jgi:transcription-repair coupling factor (superfamily II helicase)|uniref:Transcription-repair-coupling factor n=4 Tax=Marinobacter TaxID=2742 RepID=A0A1W6K8C8_9GAMM|nr:MULTISPECIES: transcription-repair coupling factor [Marinobacter]ARM83674.1 transcription-repair-coupling factor [Marinobacter salarius]MBJ7301976.1 transcription-repair coupling factor [Marinobacter salarius]MDC8455959.1 transcription-repair coupling factor [Marinobacter sp. DS40M6]MDM8178413.1 transcription-repair coupling factor [Marinobacter salarius]RUT75167.1 transcription-repair coupling factor [Marinobacter sp. NP-6]